MPECNNESKVRIMYVANAFLPTLQINFVRPLNALVESGEIATELLSEQQMKELFGKRLRESKVQIWIDDRVKKFKPTVIVFCRYSGPHAEYLTNLAKAANIPTVFHIDDDLLNVPLDIGLKKHEYHNHPKRLATIKFLLDNVSLIFFSTELLKQRFQSYGYKNEFRVGKINCTGEVLARAVDRPVKKIGYMGFDHAHDFEIVLPVIIKLLRRYPQIDFQLFGAIPKSISLDEFGDRVSVISPISNYEAFMEKFTALNWDIGLCPLAKTKFNEVKSNNKWVEYTSVGTAVVATKGTIYDECCSNGCGNLVETAEQWEEALEFLITNSAYRFDLVSTAQKKLEQDYSVASLREQVLEVLSDAHKVKRKK
ncbi:hypothetical protein [Marinomonas primoryensis]|uniref:Glycosyltransferase n=1 Tax=Marinomonas primoryensis TaxID=178399 RepID=A0ABV0KYX1_9GAMM